MDKEQAYTEEEKRKIFCTMFEQHKRMRKNMALVMGAATSKYASLHVTWLLRIQDVILENGEQDSIDVSTLVESLEDSPQNLSRTLRTLEKEKLLERHTDPADRRKTYILVTDLGKQVLQDTGREMIGFITELVEVVGYDRMRQVEEEVEAMLDAMEQTPCFRAAEKGKPEDKKAGNRIGK